MWNPLAALGERSLRQGAAFVSDALSLGEVLSRTIAATAGASRGALGLARRTTVMQIYFTGVQSVPVAGFLAFLIGFGFGQLVLSTGLFLLVPILRDLIVMQFGPLLAALAVVARSSPAVAVELGNMKVAGELRMLESFGIDPFRHLALPRILGITIGVAALCFIVTGIALLSMYIGIRGNPAVGGADFWLAISQQQALRIGILGLSFGAAVALVSIHQGLSLIPYYTEVPKAASRAVVKSLVACALLDAVVSVFT